MISVEMSTCDMCRRKMVPDEEHYDPNSGEGPTCPECFYALEEEVESILKEQAAEDAQKYGYSEDSR